jgi:hypothetical protein
MTREEAIEKWIMPAIKNTWNEKKCGEIIEALEQEPCEDAVSREAILLQIGKIKDNYGGLLDVARFIRKLPSVQPKQKIGHWKYYYSPFQRVSAFSDTKAQCNKCGYTKNRYDGEILNYCPNCGRKMEV